MDKNPSSKRYPPELKERAVRMVGELRRADPNDQGVISRVARQLGVGTESLRQWVKQAEVDAGRQRGTTTAEHEELVTLRKEVKELRRANDILQAAASFMSTPRLCRLVEATEGSGPARRGDQLVVGSA
jgi:transposase